ncbi:22K [Gould's wattled bat adenovirus 1]|nr:22K [Mastadenovirus sp.]
MPLRTASPSKMTDCAEEMQHRTDSDVETISSASSLGSIEEVEEEEEVIGESEEISDEEPGEGPPPAKRSKIPRCPGAPRKRAAPSRWDRRSAAAAVTDDGKRQARKSYRSWRANKQKILEALEQSNGNVAFVRRYMLFKNGTNMPKNVIHYYNSRYRRRAD